MQLVGALEQMGIITTAENYCKCTRICPPTPRLRRGRRFYYSKNIPLTNWATPYHFINKIKEANVKLSLDTNQTDYRNEGHCYKWHCNSYEVVFYDKIKDLEKAKKSSKRATEKDSELQLGFLKPFENRKRFEILRMEFV